MLKRIVTMIAVGCFMGANADTQDRSVQIQKTLDTILSKSGITVGGEFKSQYFGATIGGEGSDSTKRTSESNEFTSVDFSKDMAVAGLIQDLGGEQIVGVAHYYNNPATHRAEVSFLVRDDWQAKGLGTDLLEILTEIARKRGITGFEARVLVANQSMMAVFYNSGYKVTTRREDDVFLLEYDFKNQEK